MLCWIEGCSRGKSSLFRPTIRPCSQVVATINEEDNDSSPLGHGDTVRAVIDALDRCARDAVVAIKQIRDERLSPERKRKKEVLGTPLRLSAQRPTVRANYLDRPEGRGWVLRGGVARLLGAKKFREKYRGVVVGQRINPLVLRDFRGMECPGAPPGACLAVPLLGVLESAAQQRPATAVLSVVQRKAISETSHTLSSVLRGHRGERLIPPCLKSEKKGSLFSFDNIDTPYCAFLKFIV